jgi:predicted Zn-dependent peptidase
MKKAASVAVLALLLLCLLAAAPPNIAPVKFTDTRLPNGLRVIIAEDHYAPVFSIAVTYNVGARDERPGRTGFAHLFEHMMFKGSERVGPGEHFFLIYNNGGNMNGSTNPDRTNYYETLPKNQLDLGLFLESDRMRSLAITKENLDNQRNAVQEERRLGVDNVAYGQTAEKMLELAYENFAYKHSTIGSMADLNAATVEDVKAFFKTYYAPNNAVLTLAGDLNTADTLARVKKYFGDIPRQAPPPPVDMTEPQQTAEKRARLEDKLARLTRMDIAYKIPPGNTADSRALSMLGGILGGGGGFGGRFAPDQRQRRGGGGPGGVGNSSRLYQKLVREKEAVVSIFAGVGETRGPGLFRITAVVRPGKTPEEVEALIYEEVEKVRNEAVTDEELQRARSGVRRRQVQTREGSLGLAMQLGIDAVYFDDPGRINTETEKRLAVTAADMRRVAQKYLAPANRIVIYTLPAGGGAAKKAAE